MKNVQHSLYDFAFRSTPPFHRHSVFIQCYLFYIHHHKKSSKHFIPVVVIVYPPNHPRIMHKIMYITCKLFILMSGEVTRSMLFILCPPDLRGVRSVLTRHLSSGLHTYVVCKHDEIIGRVNADM